MNDTLADTPFDVQHPRSDAAVIGLTGDITAASEEALMAAFADAATDDVITVALDFTDLAYMNSGGIGLLVTLLVRANRQHQRLVAFGLNEHYRQIFSLTRLDEVIALHETEVAALAATEVDR